MPDTWPPLMDAHAHLKDIFPHITKIPFVLELLFCFLFCFFCLSDCIPIMRSSSVRLLALVGVVVGVSGTAQQYDNLQTSLSGKTPR